MLGYARSVARTGFHPVDGARFVCEAGFSELVVSLVAFHSAAEFEARERGLDYSLLAFARPPVELSDMLTSCDLTTGPDGTPVEAEHRISEVLERYGTDDPVHRAVRAARGSAGPCSSFPRGTADSWPTDWNQ